RLGAVSAAVDAVADRAILLEERTAGVDGLLGGLDRVAGGRVGRPGVRVHAEDEHRTRDDTGGGARHGRAVAPGGKAADLAAVDERETAGERERGAEHFVPVEDIERQGEG